MEKRIKLYLILACLTALTLPTFAFAKSTKTKTKASTTDAQTLGDAKTSPDDKSLDSDTPKDTADKDKTDKDSNKPSKPTKASSSRKTADDDDGPLQTKGKSFSGNVSWYGIPFHGRKTASGEVFDMNKLSAAHLKLPLPSRALVEDPRSGNAVIVRVNDRGPYCKTRVMDLSREAGRRLGILSRGVGYADITILEKKAAK